MSVAAARELIQGSEPRAIGVDREHCPFVRTAAEKRRAIEGAARQSQTANRKSSVTVWTRTRRRASRREAIERRESCAIGVDGEQRAAVTTAASPRRPVQ